MIDYREFHGLVTMQWVGADARVHVGTHSDVYIAATDDIRETIVRAVLAITRAALDVTDEWVVLFLTVEPNTPPPGRSEHPEWHWLVTMESRTADNEIHVTTRDGAYLANPGETRRSITDGVLAAVRSAPDITDDHVVRFMTLAPNTH